MANDPLRRLVADLDRQRATPLTATTLPGRQGAPARCCVGCRRPERPPTAFALFGGDVPWLEEGVWTSQAWPVAVPWPRGQSERCVWCGGNLVEVVR